MPPRKSFRGGPRLTTRSSARKSTAKTKTVTLSIEELADSSPQTSPLESSAQDGLVNAAAPEYPLLKGAQLSPLSVVPKSLEDPPESVSTNVRVSEAQVSAEKVETAGEPSATDPLPSKCFQLRQCETLKAPDPKIISETDKVSVSPQPEQNLENENGGVAVGDQDADIETSNSPAVETSNVEGAISSVGKTKKMVKKKVKVVKKIIKKVPKRVVKGEPASKAGEKPAAMSIDPSASAAASSNTENSELKKVAAVSANPSASGAASLNAKESESEKHAAMSVDPSASAAASSNTKNSNTDASVTGKNEEPHESINAVTGEVMKFFGEEKDDTKALEVNDGSSGGDDDRDVEKDGPAISDAVSVGEGATTCGDRKVEPEVKEDDCGNFAKGEDEMGDPTIFSGEMEAMERRKRRKTEIFIGGLDKDTKEEDIRKVFEQVGELLEVRVLLNGKTRKNKGYAFLRYASAEDAKRALEKFSKVEICGKQCGAAPVEGNDTLYLGNIDRKWKTEDIEKLLMEIGIEKIDKVTVMVNPSNNERNRGFAFVEFETSKDAQIAFRRLQKNDIVGKRHNLKVAWAQPLNEVDEQEMLKVKTVYAEFIPSTWDEVKVKDLFKKFGEIDSVVLARNLRTSKRKDYAFISYKTREAAISCIEAFNQKPPSYDVGKVNVKVSLAKPMLKGKQPKQVASFVSNFPKEKPTTNQSNIRLIDPRNMERLVVPHYGAQRAEASANAELLRLVREQGAWKLPQEGPSSGMFGLHPYDVHRTESSATSAELLLVQSLRERAAWRQTQMLPNRGLEDLSYPNALSGRKRPFFAMEADPLHSEMSRYPYPRLEPTVPAAAPYPRLEPSVSAAAPSYNSMSPNLSSSAHSFAHHQQPTGYDSRLLYGSRDYPGNEIRDSVYSSSNFMYRRY